MRVRHLSRGRQVLADAERWPDSATGRPGSPQASPPVTLVPEHPPAAPFPVSRGRDVLDRVPSTVSRLPTWRSGSSMRSRLGKLVASWFGHQWLRRGGGGGGGGPGG